jgi:hypothetical protein
MWGSWVVVLPIELDTRRPPRFELVVYQSPKVSLMPEAGVCCNCQVWYYVSIMFRHLVSSFCSIIGAICK